MTKIEEANFERCVGFLADMIMKYVDRLLEDIEKENKDCLVGISDSK